MAIVGAVVVLGEARRCGVRAERVDALRGNAVVLAHGWLRVRA
jgi:hypothetical protein